MDQAHEEVADVGAVVGLVEQGVLAVEDRLLQRPFADIVVQRGAGLAQEERQLLPVLEQVGDGLAQRRVGLHLPLVELRAQPGLSSSITGPLWAWWKAQPLPPARAPARGAGRRCGRPRPGLQDVPALLGEALGHVHELPPAVGQAVGQDGLAARLGTLRDSASHIWIGGGQARRRAGPARRPGSPRRAARPLKNSAIRRALVRDTMPEVNIPVRCSCAARPCRRVARCAGFAMQRQDLDRGVVVVQDLALGRLPDQLLEARARCRSRLGCTMSHCVEAGSGMPRLSCSLSRR